MSYILDALKKAEADRDPEARASLAMAQHQRRRSRWLAYVIVIALIANAAILLWLFLPQPQQQTTAREGAPPAAAQQAQQEPMRQPQQAPPPARNIAQPSAPAAVETTPTQRPTTPAAISTSPSAQAAQPRMAAETATGETIIGPGSAPAPASEPLPVSSLPPGQRERFPALSFSTHIYADDADLRAIVVNGTRLEEGDRLDDLYLHRITEDGAVFRFEGRLVSVSVLDEWN